MKTRVQIIYNNKKAKRTKKNHFISSKIVVILSNVKIVKNYFFVDLDRKNYISIWCVKWTLHELLNLVLEININKHLRNSFLFLLILFFYYLFISYFSINVIFLLVIFLSMLFFYFFI